MGERLDILHGFSNKYADMNSKIIAQLNVKNTQPSTGSVMGSIFGELVNTGLNIGMMYAMQTGQNCLAGTSGRAQQAQVETQNFAAATSLSTTAITSFESVKTQYDLAEKKLATLKQRKANATPESGKTSSAKEAELNKQKGDLAEVGKEKNNAAAIEAFKNAEAAYNKLVAAKSEIDSLKGGIQHDDQIMQQYPEAGTATVGPKDKQVKLTGGSAASTLSAARDNYNYEVKTKNSEGKEVTDPKFNDTLFNHDMEIARGLDDAHNKHIAAKQDKQAKEATLKSKLTAAGAKDGQSIDEAIAEAKLNMDELGNETMIGGDGTTPSVALYQSKMTSIDKQIAQINKDKGADNMAALDKAIEAQEKVVEQKKEALETAKAKLSDARTKLGVLREQMGTVNQTIVSNQKSAQNLKDVKNHDDNGNKRGFFNKVFGSDKHSQYKSTKAAHKSNTEQMNAAQNNFAQKTGFTVNAVRLAEIDAQIAAIDQALAES